VSRRAAAFLVGVLVFVIAAGAGGVFLATRDEGHAKPSAREADLSRVSPACSELEGPGGFADCLQPSATSSGDASGNERRTVVMLIVCDCVIDLLYPDALVVPCAVPHRDEIVAFIVGPEGGYPGSELLVDTFTPVCDTRGAAYVGGDPAAQELFATPEIPSETAEWGAYGRTIVCSVSSIRKDLRQGSVRG
jgi:hypothetical protein